MSQGQETEGLKTGLHPNGENRFLRRYMLYMDRSYGYTSPSIWKIDWQNGNKQWLTGRRFAIKIWTYKLSIFHQKCLGSGMSGASGASTLWKKCLHKRNEIFQKQDPSLHTTVNGFSHTPYAPTPRIIFIILLMILCKEQNVMMWNSSLGYRVSIQQLMDFRVSWFRVVLLGMLHLYNSYPRASRWNGCLPHKHIGGCKERAGGSEKSSSTRQKRKTRQAQDRC